MSVDDLLLGEWRHPRERGELVEALIQATRRARVAEARCRALENDQDATSGLAARVIELEDIVERQNRTIQQLNRRTA